MAAPRPSTDGEESIAIPPEDDEVGYARSRQRASFELRSAPNPRVNDQRSPTREERGSTIHVPEAWAVTDENESTEEGDEDEATVIPYCHAIQVQVTCWQKYQRYIFGGMCLLLIGAAVAIGVLLGSNNSTSFESSVTAATQGATNITLGTVEVSFGVNVTLQGIPSLDVNSDSVDDIADVLTVAMEDILPEGAAVRVVSVGGYPVSAEETALKRSLQHNGNSSTVTGDEEDGGGEGGGEEGIIVEYEIMLSVGFEAILSEDCQTSTCQEFEVDELSTLLAQDFESNVRSKIENGELTDAIQEEATIASVSELQDVTVESDSLEISELTVTVRLPSPSSSPSPPPSPYPSTSATSSSKVSTRGDIGMPIEISFKFSLLRCRFGSCQFSKPCSPSFQDKAELQAALDEYIDQDCLNNPGCAAGQIHGWPIGTWCVSQVTDMSGLFWSKYTFNEDLSRWDVSSVTDMSWMFYGSEAFNSNISSWNVSQVIAMNSMFTSAKSFNSDISNWDVSSVTNMNAMLNTATSFNQDLCAWGDKFPYDVAVSIFTATGCTFQGTPQEAEQGPFCASSCE